MSKDLRVMNHLEMMRASTNSKKNPLNLEIHPPFSLLATDNIFSPTGQFADIDLSQYNSPSFAAGHHLHTNYQSKGGH